MRLPRDLKGREFIELLGAYGYEPVRQNGSHVQVRSTVNGTAHHLTVAVHNKPIPVGTLSTMLGRVASYLEMEKDELAEQLFPNR